jgi:uncharacterized protein YggU (UPF0235/DUF167 family)
MFPLLVPVVAFVSGHCSVSGVNVRETREGVLVTVRVRPRSRPGVRVLEGEAVVGVAAAPVGGQATEEARRVLASTLGVPPSAVTLRTGRRSRVKVFHVAGLDAADVRTRFRSASGD